MSWSRTLAVMSLAAPVIFLGAGCRGQKPSPIDTTWQQVHANPNSAEALMKLAEAYTTEDKHNEAYIHFRRAWEIDSNSSEIAYQLAHTSLRLNDPHTGLSWIERARAIDPESAKAAELNGALKMTSGDPRAAIPLFKEALRLDPEFGAAQLNLVSAYKVIGDRQAALGAGAHAVKILPDQAAAHFAYADILEICGDDTAAEEHYRQAIKIGPDMPAAKLRLAQLLTRHKKFLQEAHKLAKEAHRLKPGDGAAEATAGWALFLQGEEIEGLKTIQNAARSHPFNHRIWVLFAKALQDAGHEEEARRALSIAIRVGPKPQRQPPPAPDR